MTQRDKDKIKVLINEAKVWAESNKDYLTGLDDDCEEVNVECLTIEEVKGLLENLKLKLLKDDDPNEDTSKPMMCSVCKDCGTRSREFDGKDDCDDEGAIRKAIKAWNAGRVK